MTEAAPRPAGGSLARRGLAVLCGAMLMAMMALTVGDVIGRYLLSRPITGATELTEMMLVAVVFLGLPAVSLDRDHVAVDLITERLPASVQRWRECVMALVSAAVLSLIAWRIWVYSGQIGSYGGATNSLRLPIAPLGYLCAACCGLAALFMPLAAARRFGRH